MLIYLIRNLIDGKLYVGQTCGSISARWRTHAKDAKAGCNTYLHKAIRKHGVSGFSIELICKCQSIAELSQAEILHIARLQTYPPSAGIGYNMTPGGEGFHGKRETPAWNKGKKLSDATRRKMSLSQIGNKNRLGIPHSVEVREKISRGGKGIKRSVEFSRKLSERNRRTPSPRRGMKTDDQTKEKQSEAAIAMWAARSAEERRHVSRGIRRPKTEDHRKKLSEATKNHWAAKRATALTSLKSKS